MQASRSECCGRCRGRVVDIGEEMVCSGCGVVTPKVVLEEREDRIPHAVDFTNNSLGSFLGPLEYGYSEIFSRGLSSSPSTFKYLKTVSDHSYRGGAAVYNCARLIERVCEKLVLPSAVVAESVAIARSVMDMRSGHGEITIPSISAFAVINACKRVGVSSVGVREILAAHRNLGYRVKGSVMIRIALDSPVRTRPRRAEEYVANVVVRLRSILEEEEAPSPRYLNVLYDAARAALESVDGPSRGGHNPRALAATAVYAGEIALTILEQRKKRISQRVMADTVEVAEYTIREQYVELFRPQMEEILVALRSRGNLRRPPTTETAPGLLSRQVLS